MDIRYRLTCVIKLFILFGLLVSVGCATNTSLSRTENQSPAESALAKDSNSTPSQITSTEEIAAPSKTKEEKRGPLHLTESLENSSQLPAPEAQTKSDQEVLDSALEFCQASNDYWEHGDLENAIDALDQAYSLVLKVNSDEAAPEILQQKEDLRFTVSKRIIQVYASRFTVANGNHKAIPLVTNSHVEKALKLFKGRERKFFLDAYRRSGRYRPAIIKALNEAGLPEELSWLPLIESGFKTRAFSRARALGMWQFIASTGYKFGLKRDRWIDERMDPDKSTTAAIAYLKELHQIFCDWTTVLAAYNCGEGRVLRQIRTQKINYLDNFWDLYTKLPRETACYVPRFLAVLHIVNDPEAHGFILPPVEEEVEVDKIVIGKQVHLKTAAKHLGVSYEALKGLNPALRQNCTPSKPYAFKVPKDKGTVLLSKIDNIPVWHPPVPAYVTHRVRKGESLSVIALRYRASVRSIMALNNLRSKHFVKAGKRLKVPTRRTYASLNDSASPVYGSKAERPSKYVVRKGDSLWKIARRFGTTTKTIQSLNQLNHTHLQIRQVLKMPGAFAAISSIDTKSYKVLEGDSSYLIAKRYQMKLSEFLKLNHLTSRSTIYPGQTLLVKTE